jgi:hypothetical protein
MDRARPEAAGLFVTGCRSGAYNIPKIEPHPPHPRVDVDDPGGQSTSGRLGNGIFRPETDGRFRAREAKERPHFGSQTAQATVNPRTYRRVFGTWKQRPEYRTEWWAMQGSNL